MYKAHDTFIHYKSFGFPILIETNLSDDKLLADIPVIIHVPNVSREKLFKLGIQDRALHTTRHTFLIIAYMYKHEQWYVPTQLHI